MFIYYKDYKQVAAMCNRNGILRVVSLMHIIFQQKWYTLLFSIDYDILEKTTLKLSQTVYGFI